MSSKSNRESTAKSSTALTAESTAKNDCRIDRQIQEKHGREFPYSSCNAHALHGYRKLLPP
jgi:hypothetical protein